MEALYFPLTGYLCSGRILNLFLLHFCPSEGQQAVFSLLWLSQSPLQHPPVTWLLTPIIFHHKPQLYFLHLLLTPNLYHGLRFALFHFFPRPRFCSAMCEVYSHTDVPRCGGPELLAWTRSRSSPQFFPSGAHHISSAFLSPFPGSWAEGTCISPHHSLFLKLDGPP